LWLDNRYCCVRYIYNIQ